MDALQTRHEQIAELDSSEFTGKLRDRYEVLNEISLVVEKAVKDGKIAPWEYPQVEQGLGMIAAAFHGVPFTPTTSGR